MGPSLSSGAFECGAVLRQNGPEDSSFRLPPFFD
jgi:hypothetical protein